MQTPIGRPKGKGTALRRMALAIHFIHVHRSWTTFDLADELEITTARARGYVRELSCIYPIREIRPFRNCGKNKMPALYGMMEGA